MNMKESQTMYRKDENLTPESSPAVIVELTNLSLKDSTHSYVIDRVNGKMHAITVEALPLNPEKS